MQVNGQNFTGPIYVTRKGTLKGFAFVSHGADDSTTVAIAAQKRNKKMQAANFDSWVSEMGIDRSLMTEQQLAGLHANYEGRSDANDADFAATAPMIAASADPVDQEHRRIKQIEAATRGEWGDFADRVHSIKAQAIGGDMSVDDLIQSMREIRMNQAMQNIPAAHTIHAPRGDMHPQIIEASFALAGGLSNPEKHYSEQTLDAADRMKGDASLHQLLMEGAVRNGYRCRPGQGVTAGNLRSVLEAAFAPIQAAGSVHQLADRVEQRRQ